MSRWRHLLTPVLGVLLGGGALWLLAHELRDYKLDDVLASLRALPPWRIAAAVGLTALNYTVLTAYDALALRYVRHPLPYRQSALASFIAYAFSIALGHAVLTGGAVRYRLYTAWGVPAESIAKVVAFCGLAFWVGYLTLGGVIFLVAPPPVPDGFPVSARVLGGAFVALFAVWLAVNAVRQRPLTIWRWTVDVPGWKMTGGQAAIASVDLTIAGAVLWVLLPEGTIGFGPLLAAYLLAVIAGVVSLVPGGLGVFDGVLVALLAPTVPASVALGAVVAYRGVYYLLPLVVAALAMVGTEVARQKAAVGGRLSGVATATASAAGVWLPRLVPRALATTTFLAGSVLLVTGALPAVGTRMAWLARVVPLGAVEVSHFVGSLVGAALLVVARGLWRRRDGAYWTAVALLALGVVAALVRGVDYVEAGVLAVTLVVLIPCRRYFDRRSALLSGPASPGWAVAVGLVLVGAVALGLFAYREVAYADDLWWHFAVRSDAPRFLRGIAGAGVVVLVAGVIRLMRSAPRAVGVDPTPEALDRARAVIARTGDTEANLALLADKRLLFMPDVEPGGPEDGFVMYAPQGESWIAMGGPVGPEATREALAWAFRGAAEAAGARPVFYEAPEADLPLLLDVGLVPYKLGEEARVPLAGFTLDGSSRKKLRQTQRKLDALCTVEVIPASGVAEILPELRRVSDAWLGGKAGAEKGFSLGLFDETYLGNFPVAVVQLATDTGASGGTEVTDAPGEPASGLRPEDEAARPVATDARGPIVAFANLWANDRLAGATVDAPEARAELSIDLMRFDREAAPPGVMEYLFTWLMVWGAAEGYGAFSLGMAPMSGLEPTGDARALAPLWNPAGALLYRHGEHFYNFQGLRAYKSKFDPEWEPRYLAVPRGRVALAASLLDVTTRIAGGLGGLVRKA